MGIYSKTVLFARRLSVFYLLILIFSVFFGVFYLKYLPANQAELNTRGFRILNQLARNLQAKDTTLLGTFDNLNGWVNPADTNGGSGGVMARRLAQGLKVQQQIQRNVNFVIAALPGVGVANDTLGKERPDSLRDVAGQGWSMVFRMKDKRSAVVRMGDFAEPVLAARDDLFDSYVLLDGPAEGSRRMNILYLQKEFSPADRLSADSALAMEKNTDLAAISDIVVGGQAFVLFIQSFELAGKRIELGGLIAKATYEREVKSLPASFVVSMVLIIFIGLMVLPFIKIFFISSGETMDKWDVIKVMLAVYLGTGVMMLAGCYFAADRSAQTGVEARMGEVSDSLEADIQRDLDAARRQLNGYVAAYESTPFRKVLAYQDYDAADNKKTDSAFSPRTYPLTARILWFDSSGNTLAKWNPFNFISPPSSVSAYPYYDELLRKDADDYQFVLSAGESNITSEFQFFLARRLRQQIRPVVPNGSARGDTTKSVWSVGVLMPFYMHCGLQPVLPRGMGFCLVDNRSMQVILHSDARRNLAENLYLETGSNARLKNCVNNRVKAVIRQVDLYGSSHTLTVRPVDGQNLSLVVFYDDSTHAENIFRLLHFGGETFLYLAVLIMLSTLLSTNSAGKPSKLSFRLDRLEWIRPVARNQRSYGFSRRYFSWLLIIGGLVFVFVWVFGLDIRIVYYVSLLMPVYAVWAFVAGRKHIEVRFRDDGVGLKWRGWKGSRRVRGLTGVRGLAGLGLAGKAGRAGFNGLLNWYKEFLLPCRFIVIVLLILNWYIFQLILTPAMDHGPEVIWAVCAFQVAAFAAMVVRFYAAFFWETAEKHYARLNITMAYMRSVFFSVLVMSMLPAFGVLWYGWTVEKVQFARSDLLYVAGKNKAHMEYIARGILQDTKPTVQWQLQKSDAAYPQNLLTGTGHYLAGETIAYSPYRKWLRALRTKNRDIDEPYIKLLDDLFVITDGEYDAYSVMAASADSNWSFAVRDGRIGLGQAVKADEGLRLGGGRERLEGSSDPLFGDFVVGMPLKGALFDFADIGVFQEALCLLAVLAFLWFLPRLMTLAVFRIFLLRFFASEPPKVNSILPVYFPDADAGAGAGASPEIPVPDFLYRPDGVKCPIYQQEEYILEMMLVYESKYQMIWEGLSGRQRYFVYDFAADGYTNYKESETVMQLYFMGVLRYNRKSGRDQWRLFSISFREFVLRKKGSPEVTKLKDEFSLPGLWATIRIPALIFIAACAVLLLMTQENVSHQVTVAITSMGAIVPVVMEITKKITGKGN